MPGVVGEPDGHKGTRSDHDRDSAVDSFNGPRSAEDQRTAAPDKGKALAADKDHEAVGSGEAVDVPALPPSTDAASHEVERSDETRSRMNDLPDEIIHITQGFIPLSLLLSRLAQVSHNTLQEKIVELSKMPLPGALVNGNAAYSSAGADDSSNENLRKKAAIANLAQDLHGKWLKALVIAEWSRKSGMVSKLIDLKFHIDQQRMLYDAALDNIANVKRDLTFARMPSPDLKTALQVLATGSAPWMPDLSYIELPPLTPGEQLRWMNELDTLLSLRLNINDYDSIPYHFRNYKVGQGRVTFMVEGEFEVDLTIADEDFDKQLWFIDFRYAFTPAASSLSDSLRAYLEVCVNEALSKDGLAGCYQFLHEFVLTCKINELKRQATQLSRSSWSGTLTIEPLNRALAIQYWTPRAAVTGTKSWILVTVNSARTSGGTSDPKSSSFITAKWYRDNKEVTEVDIELDKEHLSAEDLLTNVVGRHVGFLLTSIRSKLMSAARFQSRDSSMDLGVSLRDPTASYLSIQVGYGDKVTLLVEPTTGAFVLKPHSKFAIQYEHQLNAVKNPAEEGGACLEKVRCAMMENELNRQANSMGWHLQKSPLTLDQMKSVTELCEWSRAVWLQKDGWGASWFVAIFLGVGGDEWWLLEANRNDTRRVISFKQQLPLSMGYPDLSEGFWNSLALFGTGLISQSVDLRELNRQGIKSKPGGSVDLLLPQQVRNPSIEISLSALFPAMVAGGSRRKSGRTRASSESDSVGADNAELFSLMRKYTGAAVAPRQSWADDAVSIHFKGIRTRAKGGEEPEEDDGSAAKGVRLTCISDAIIRVQRPAKFEILKDTVDHDVSYNPRKGEFSLRIRRGVDEPILEALKSRIKAIDRFVSSFEALQNAGGAIRRVTVTLRTVAFTYGEPAPQETGRQEDESSRQTDAQLPSKRWLMVLDLSMDDIGIELEAGNPHLRVVDLMRSLVNGEGGIGALMAWLPASLPTLTAIEEMQSKWEDEPWGKRAQMEFSMKTMAWISITYTMTSSSGGTEEKKRVALDVRLQPRQEEAWWHISRSDAGAATDDEFTKALKPIWNGNGDGWLGLLTGAAGKPRGGMVNMLRAVNEAIGVAVRGNEQDGKDGQGEGKP